jgi:hypothetical protein
MDAYHIDSPKFVDPVVLSFFIQDKIVRDAGWKPDDVRLVRLIRKPQDADLLAAFDRWWAEETAPLFFGSNTSTHLRRHTILSAEAAGTDADAFYGIESSWWPSVEMLSEALETLDRTDIEEQRLIARERIQFPLR